MYNNTRTNEVSVYAAISESEWAIAAAAWVSVHYLAPIPIEEDNIAAAIRWKDDIGDVAIFGDQLFPSNPDHYDRDQINPATLKTASRVLPAGSAKALWLYHFFEYTTDAAATESKQVLAAVSDALRNRWLDSEATPVQFGPYVLGSLGVVTTGPCEQDEDAAVWFGGHALSGSYAEYGRALAEQYYMLLSERHPSLNEQGWSPSWTEWHRLNGPIQQKLIDGKDRWTVSQRRLAGPSLSMSRRDIYADPLGSWPQYALRAVLRLDETKLSHVLDDCIQHCKGVFFTGAGWTHAPDGHAFLTRKQPTVSAGGLRQLLLVPPAETVVAAAIERGYYAPRGERRASFAECVAAALIRVYTNSECRNLLAPFMRNAGGSDYDRVLHWIVKADPVKVLEQQLSANPSVASAIARLTCAPLTFHSETDWDQSDPDLMSELIRYVQNFLGDEKVPAPPERALPFQRAAEKGLGGMSALDELSSVRRRTEYLFKTAIQYLYALLAWHKLVPNSWPEDCREPSRLWTKSSSHPPPWR